MRDLTFPAEPGPPDVKVLVVHDRAIVRDGIAALLACERDLRVLAVAADVAAGIAAVVHEPPHVIVGALRTTRQGALSPADVMAVRRLRGALPWADVVALVPDRDPATLRQVLYAGVRGCVVEETAATELVDAVRGVAHGQLYIGSAPAPGEERRDAAV
jgi:DNA-binding NarL/FixJ family response regulator